MKHLPRTAALLVVDMQLGFDDPAWGRRNNPGAEANAALLIAAWRLARAPVIHVHHDSPDPSGYLRRGTPGNAPKPEGRPIAGEPVYRKAFNSAFIGTSLDADLRDAGISTLVIVGLTTNHCVSTTARMAGNLGYETFVVSDATAAFDRANLDGKVRSADDVHDAALSDLNGEFARIVDTRQLIAALPGATGRTPLAGIARRAGLLGAALVMTSSAAVAGGADSPIRPGDDFYSYANAAWVKQIRLPDGAAKIDSTSMLRAENAQRVRGLIDDAVKTSASNTPARPDVRKIADYYASRRDTAAIEAKGLSPLSSDLAGIAAIADRRALAGWLGRTTRLDDGSNAQTESLWGVWVHQGFHDPYRYAAHLVQGGLGMARDDYLGAGADAATRRTAYRARVANVLKLAGFDRADERAGRVLNLETAIARTQASRADTDDVFKTDNAWRRADFTAKAPGIDWSAYFAAAGLDPAASFIVWQPGSVIGGARLVGSVPLDAWKDYLAFHLIDHYAAVLPAAARGTPDAPDPLAATGTVFGDAIGRLYVERYFPPRAKAAATAMIANVRTAFRARLARVSWMAPTTRAKALAKLATLDIGLGYPDRWTGYAKLSIVRGDAFGNLKRADAFAYARETAKLGRPVDPAEWPGQLQPQMVGGILNFSPNSMQFTAGLLQPPYFDATGDAAANYGSAGAGIAHEISHSFDELGNIYDAQGRLGLWWSKEDIMRYRAAIAPLGAQLDACSPMPGLFARGKQVLGESSADIAGLTVAYDAYHLSLHGRPDVVKGGLTGDQRFFVAFAQRWRRVQTGDALRAQIDTDTHAPPQCRSELVRFTDAWTRAFGVRPGDRLFVRPDARMRTW